MNNITTVLPYIKRWYYIKASILEKTGWVIDVHITKHL